MNQEELLNHTLTLYYEKNYAAAYDFITNAVQQEGIESPRTYNFRICLANLRGDSPLALSLFAEALDKGYWSDPDQMLRDDDLLSLRENPEFQRLIEICRQQQAAAQEAARPELHLRLPEAPRPAPLLIALHGNGENAAITLRNWASLPADGWALAVPQSAQLMMQNSFIWDDLERATAEMRTHADTLRQNSKLDFSRPVVAGFSMGTRQALWSVLEGVFPARGLILLGPWLPELAEWKPLLPRLGAQGTRTYIIIGEADQQCLPHAEALNAALQELGLPCEMERHAGMDHRYPDDFATSYRQALNFITAP